VQSYPSGEVYQDAGLNFRKKCFSCCFERLCEPCFIQQLYLRPCCVGSVSSSGSFGPFFFCHRSRNAM